MAAMGWRRTRVRTSPSWSSTGTPSAVSHTSVSRPVAPSRRASSNASMVFSGAWARAPRWAKAMGGSSNDGGTPSGYADPFVGWGGVVEGTGRFLGQPEAEATALAEPALAPDVAAMELDEAAADVEADAGPAVLARRRAVQLVEALEQLGDVPGEDAGSEIAH